MREHWVRLEDHICKSCLLALLLVAVHGLQIPLSPIEQLRGSWANLCFDLVALVDQSFRAQPYR
jgi:hypothetical protein